MYRLAILLALLVALGAAGCGSSDDDSDSAPSAVAQTDESASSGDDADDSGSDASRKKDDAAEKSSKDEDDEAEDDDEPKSERELEEEQEEAIAKLPLKQRTALVNSVVRSTLLRFGLKVAAVEVRDGARKVTVVVTRATACRAVARQEANMVLAIQHGAPIVKSVRFEVGGTGKQLGYYVLGCKKPEMPDGAGRVVLEHTGVGGPYTSRAFEIKSKRWALEWENQANSLAVIVIPIDKKAKENYAKPVGSQKPESGRYDYPGPGKYRIKAQGAGQWSIRVKEMR